MKNAIRILFAITASVTPALVEAHHGWSEFDATREVALTGIVTDFHFVNPHCVVEFDVKDDKGMVRHWQGEFSSPGPMVRKGWTAASLEPGDKVAISGHPAKNDVRAVHVTWIRLSDGHEFKIEDGR